MPNSQIAKKKIVFLFSDTGGGHRSAAQAIIEVLHSDFPERFETEMVDFFTEYAPPPLNYAGPTYPAMSDMKLVWELGYKFLDNKRRMDTIYDLLWPYVRPRVQKMIKEHPCDLLVSVHSIVNQPVLRIKDKHTPFITVVVDLVSTPAFWYEKDSDLIITPTAPAYERGIRLGIPNEKLRLIGLPISTKFDEVRESKLEIRRRLGWHEHRPVVLLIGGGEGMGKIGKTAEAINSMQLPVSLVVVTGKNEALKTKLEKKKWQIPAHIFGFVHEIPEFMRAADILITKAGPTTLCEAFTMGLPVIISSYVPGQERGNVVYTIQNNAGVYAPTVERVISSIRYWLDNPHEMEKTAEYSRKLAHPQAAREIAKILANWLA